MLYIISHNNEFFGNFSFNDTYTPLQQVEVQKPASTTQVEAFSLQRSSFCALTTQYTMNITSVCYMSNMLHNQRLCRTHFSLSFILLVAKITHDAKTAYRVVVLLCVLCVVFLFFVFCLVLCVVLQYI
jgi:hypothetical protein